RADPRPRPGRVRHPQPHTARLQLNSAMFKQRARMQRLKWSVTAVFMFSCAAYGEHVSNPKASYIDVKQRHAELARNKDPRTAQAIASIDFCTNLPLVDPPSG